MIEKIEACVLPVRDLAESKAFYVDCLGFDLLDQSQDLLVLGAGEAEVVLISIEAARREAKFAGVKPGAASAIHFRVDDPDQMFERVARTATVLDPVGDRPYGDRDFTIADPDGYRLVFGSAMNP